MSVIDYFISKLAPYDCIGCGYEGNLICNNCAGRYLQLIPERCYRCRKVSTGAQTCPSCRRTSKLRAVKVALVYDGLAKELIWQMKFKGARLAAVEMCRYMPDIKSSVDAYLVPVPTATSRVRRRGYDQAKLLARELARCNRLPYLDCLVRSGQAHQVGASRRERLEQLNSAFRTNAPSLVRGQHIILVDDVITTGATLEAAATVLRQEGAKSIEAVIFAQP